jgi:hypothetical protein
MASLPILMFVKYGLLITKAAPTRFAVVPHFINKSYLLPCEPIGNDDCFTFGICKYDIVDGNSRLYYFKNVDIT